MCVPVFSTLHDAGLLHRDTNRGSACRRRSRRSRSTNGSSSSKRNSSRVLGIAIISRYLGLRLLYRLRYLYVHVLPPLIRLQELNELQRLGAAGKLGEEELSGTTFT